MLATLFSDSLKVVEFIQFYSTFHFREGLGEGYDGDIAFASSLETFGGGHNDPISVAFGGLSFTSYSTLNFQLCRYTLNEITLQYSC